MKKKIKKGINAPGNGCLTLLVRAAKQALVGQFKSSRKPIRISAPHLLQVLSVASSPRSLRVSIRLFI